MVKVLLRVLVAGAFCVALLQITLSLSGGLTRWKGGGFGMYTEPHPSKRRVWLTLTTDDGIHPVMLFPIAKPLLAVDRQEHKADLKRIGEANRLAGRLATSGDFQLVEKIIGLVKDLNWGWP